MALDGNIHDKEDKKFREVNSGTPSIGVYHDAANAGEDLVNDVKKVEHRYSGTFISADALVKTGVGYIHSLTFSCIDAAPTAGTIIVYDNTAESGTILYSETFDTTAFRGYTITLDKDFSVGLYVGFTTTADVGVSVSYR